MKTLLITLACAAGLAGLLPGCAGKMYDPEWATQPYPGELHSTQLADMHVFRRDTKIEIVNASPHSFRDFNLWINQRYVRRVDSLEAGQTLTLSLWEFFDEHGDRFNAGGFFRVVAPTPVRLVQIQTTDDQPMVGLVAIRREEVTLRPEAARR